MKKLRLLLPLWVCALASAQDARQIFSQAPPDVEQALRARVSGWYQAHVDGKFRQAEQFVAEDTKDWYYGSEKGRILGFKIVSTSYSDNFTKAKVITNVDVEWHNPRLGKMVVHPPQSSLWKIENGQWCWYLDLSNKQWESPWGTMKPGPGDGAGHALKMNKVEVGQVMSAITTDKDTLKLSSYQKSNDTVTLTNHLPGTVVLTLDFAPVPGLTGKLDKKELREGESAKVSVQFDPKDRQPKQPVAIRVRVDPTAQVVLVAATFATAPEVLSALPKEVREAAERNEQASPAVKSVAPATPAPKSDRK